MTTRRDPLYKIKMLIKISRLVKMAISQPVLKTEENPRIVDRRSLGRAFVSLAALPKIMLPQMAH